MPSLRSTRFSDCCRRCTDYLQCLQCDVMYKRRRNIYKYLHKKNKSALKNNVERGSNPVNKNPSQDRVSVGRSNETILSDNNRDTCSTLPPQGYICSYTASNSQATPQRCHPFKMVSNRTKAVQS